MALETVVRLVDRVFYDFRWGGIDDEIAPNLPLELDLPTRERMQKRRREIFEQLGLITGIKQLPGS